MPSAQEQQRRYAGDRHHICVLRHKEARELHAAVLGVKTGHQFVLRFRKIKWDSVRFRETRNHEKQKCKDLREGHLKDVPTRYKAQIVSSLTVGDASET